MFTGLITTTGEIISIENLSNFYGKKSGFRVVIRIINTNLHNICIGDSISVQGMCATVESILEDNFFSIIISYESLNCIACLKIKSIVNIEKSLRVGNQIGGHFVLGHVDCTGKVRSCSSIGESMELIVLLSKKVSRFMTYKGSVAINGVSLTINRVNDTGDNCEISLNIIPYTLDNTTFRDIKINDIVNIEVDIIARYVNRMMKYH